MATLFCYEYRMDFCGNIPLKIKLLLINWIFSGRYEQAPSHRLQKYPPQGPQGPPPQLQGPPNQQPQSQSNYNNNYPSSIPPMQHQPNNYYGPQGEIKHNCMLRYSCVIILIFRQWRIRSNESDSWLFSELCTASISIWIQYQWIFTIYATKLSTDIWLWSKSRVFSRLQVRHLFHFS